MRYDSLVGTVFVIGLIVGSLLFVGSAVRDLLHAVLAPLAGLPQ